MCLHLGPPVTKALIIMLWSKGDNVVVPVCTCPTFGIRIVLTMDA